MVGLIILCVVSGVQAGCAGDSAGPADGDETPAFGDVTFSPSSPDIGSERIVQLAVRNETTRNLTSVLLDIDAARPATMPNLPCTSIATFMSTDVIPLLEPGGQAIFTAGADTIDVDFTECPAGAYDVEIIASVGGEVLATATFRFTLELPPPVSAT